MCIPGVENEKKPPTAAAAGAVAIAKAAVRTISLKEVERHNTAADFWCVIDNKVYDLSGFQHPGGKIINMCAGTDCSVLFHNYHYDANEKMPYAVLKKRCIGTVAPPHQSPRMGAFYEKLSQEVAKELAHLPRYPFRAQVLVVLDLVLCLATTALCWCLALDVLIPRHPLLVFILPFFAECFGLRVSGQNHAVGHVQVFGPKGTAAWELILLMFGNGSMPVYGLPSEEANLREKMNEHRSISEHEYGFRGPYEHQGIHHVKGTDFEDDDCYMVASSLEFIRLAHHTPFHWVHRLQAYDWYVFVLESAGWMVQYVYSARLTASYVVYMLQHGMYQQAAASFVGTFSVLAMGFAACVVPILCDVRVVPVILMVRYMLGMRLLFFFGQHRWDSAVDEQQAALDWGRANLRACYSVHAKHTVVSYLHPVLWFMGGAMPATHTYHLEHTLFPGINYLYLPRVAEQVERVCREFNMDADEFTIQGMQELKAIHKKWRLRYSKEHVL